MRRVAAVVEMFQALIADKHAEDGEKCIEPPSPFAADSVISCCIDLVTYRQKHYCGFRFEVVDRHLHTASYDKVAFCGQYRCCIAHIGYWLCIA